MTNDAAGASVQTGSIDTRGNFNGAGGAVTLSSQGALQFNAGATILTSGGGARAGTSGQSGGAVTLSGDTVTTTGAITTSGAAGNGADQSGGDAGAIMVTANGAVDLSAGTLTAIGGNASGGDADGGNGGAVNLDAGAASTITHANITTTGGNRAGTGTAGAGGNITIADAALLAANTTLTATGGSAGVGTGGDVNFSGTVDSSGASRTLTVNTNGATVFGDAVGSTLALSSLTTNATGTTSLGGDVTTTGAQFYGDAVTLTANAMLTGTTPTFSSMVNGGGFDLTLNFSGTTTISGASFTNINSLATGNGGTTQLTGAITTAGAQSYGDAVTLTGPTTLASTGDQAIAFGSTVNGARTLAVNTAGATTFSGVVGSATPLTGLTTDAGGTTSIGADISTNNAAVSFGDAVTLTGASTISTGAGAVTFGATLDGANALAVDSTGATTFSGAVGGATPIASLTTNAGGTTAINGGTVTTTGAQTYNDPTTLGGATTLRTTAGGAISANAAVTATAGTLTLDTGTGAATFTNAANDFGTVAITSGGTVSLVDANALTLAGAAVDTLQAQTLGGNLTVSGAITATGAGDSIVLAAAQDFINTVGAAALDPGPGRWLAYSTSPAGSTENGLVGAAGSALPRLYNRTFAGDPPASITEPGNHLIYSIQPTLTVTPDNKSKIYGADDPAQTFVAAGFVNDDGVLDSAATAGLGGSFARAVGESVGTRAITQGTFASGAGYAISFTGGQTLTITPADLTATVTQSKIYGADDPALPLGVTSLTGLVNNPAIVTWNGNVSIDDSALTSSATALTRDVGEGVGVRAITAGTFAAPSANYNAPTLAAGSTLTITPAPLTGTIADQTKTYGAADPALAGIPVTLAGLVSNPAIVTWNGIAAVDDTGQVSTSLASLTRTAGETVAGSPYAITSGTLNALSGSAAGNYTASLDTTGNTLAITPAPLTATIANQSKAYGADDPALGGIGVTFGGLVNDPAIVTWNGVVAIDDSALTSGVTSLTRVAGESVGSYNVTAGTFNAPSVNYSAPTLASTPTLTINAAPLTFVLATPAQAKAYGADDPALGGIGVTLTGLVNNPAIATWNGAAAVDDSAVTGTLTSLPRVAGEIVGTYTALTGTVTLSASDTNYAKSFDIANSPQLTITQAPLTGTIPDQTKTYGAADPALAGIPVTLAGVVSNPAIVTWNGNVAVDDTGLVSTSLASLTRVAGETVAAPGPTYAITGGTLNALSGAAAGNYTLSLSTGGNTLTITPAPLTVTADDASRLQGTPNPLFTATYSGFQFGETPAVLTGTLNFNTPATTGSPVGSYPITPWGQSSVNYSMSYVDGTLLVTGGGSPLPPTPTAGFANGSTNLVVGGLQQLGNGAANGDAGMCSGSNRPYGSALLTTAGAWSMGVCDTREREPVRLVAAPALAETPAAEKPAAGRQSDPRAERESAAAAASPTRQGLFRYNDVMTAVMFLDLAAVTELLDLGWWVDRRDSRGRTPLMAAALNGDVAMTQLLLQRGADPNRRAPDGSVLDHARKGGNAEVLDLLRRAGAQ
ncbi:MAG TPA: MBG domain-containing protein [Steroidobacteraceae bacterium]|nr:MBG domain-containing protein [Steroidobacteraceae bacterium]